MTNKINLGKSVKKYYPLGFLFLIIFGFVLIQEAKAKGISVGTASDNIGIGTDTPGTTYRLNVNGNSNITGNLNVTGNITGTSNLTGILSSGNVSAGTFGSNSGGGNYTFPGSLTFSSANPLLSSPSYFVIPGGAYFSGGTVYTESAIQARGGIHNDSGAYLSINGGTAGYTYFPGSIGIGVGSPQAKLDIVQAGNSSGGNIMLSGNKTNNAVKFGYISSAQYASDAEAEGVSLIGAANDSANNTVSIGGGIYEQNAATQIQFYTYPSTVKPYGTGGNLSMFINSSGNVGINNGNPQVKLDVKGKFQADNSGTYSTTYSWAGGTIQTNSLELMDRYGGSTGDGVYPTLTFHDYGNGGAQFSMEGSTATLHLGSGASNSAGTLAGSGGYFSKLKIWGALETTGTISAGSFSGPMSGTLNAANLSAGTFGANTGGGNYAFPGWARFEGILNTDNAFEKVLPAVSFANATANQAVDLYLGNVSFWGYIEVEVNSTYNYQSANGKLTKIFAVGTNPGGSIYNNESRVSDALGTIPDNIAIGDLVWDGANSTFKIPISHIVSSGNTFVVKVKMFTAAGAKNVLDNMSLSGVYSLSPLPRNYVNYNGNVGIGTSAPSGKLNVNQNDSLDLVNGGNVGSINLTHPSSGGMSAITFKSTVNWPSDGGYLAYYDHNNSYNYWGGSSENSALILGTTNDGQTTASDVVVLKSPAAAIIDAPTLFIPAGNVSIGKIGNGLVGTYDSTKYQGIFSMGSSWGLPADGSSTGNLYGLAWSHPNAGGVASNLNTHGLLVMENGTFLAAISGSIRSRDDMQSPIFIDRNDTSYYMDPNGTSRLNNVNITGGLTLSNLTSSANQRDFNVVKAPGLYHYDGGLSNTPAGSPNYRSIEIGADGRYSQIALPYDSDNMYFRRKTDSAWSAWRTVLTDANAGSFFQYSGFTLDANWMGANRSGFTYSVGAPWTGPVVRFDSSNYDLELNGNYGSGTALSYRIKNGDANSWNSWYRIYSDTYRPYADSAGNADTVDGQHFAWSNRSNGPTYVWAADSNGDSYLAYRPALSVAAADKLNGVGNTPNASHPGQGLKTFYNWGGSNCNGRGPTDECYANGISIGSHPGDQSYGFQIVQNMWDDNLYFRRYNAGWQTWYSVVYKDSSNNSTIGGTMTAAGFIYNSDVKLKKNIATIESPLTKILQLRGVTFNWKKDNAPGVGLIAQEVEKVFPELVSESGGIKSVQYGNLVAPLIEAVKEQQKEIESLNERIKVLEAK